MASSKTKRKINFIAENPPKGRFSEVFLLPRDKIKTNPNRFQGRKDLFAKETVEKIVGEGYDLSEDPIVVWKDSSEAYNVISGHSRFEASQILFDKGDKRLAKMPVKEFFGSLEEAINYAVLESNRSGTEEGLQSDLAAYRRAISQGFNREFLTKIFKPEKKLRFLQQIAPLDPKGLFLAHLGTNSEKHFPYLERNATWAGIARKQIPDLSNEHEREIFNFLYPLQGGKRSRLDIKKDKFFDTINQVVSKIDWDPTKSLKLENKIFTSPITSPIRQRIIDLSKELEDLATKRRRAEENLATARREKNEARLRKYTQQIGDYSKLILRVLEEKKAEENNLYKVENQVVSDLFNQPVESSAKSKRESFEVIAEGKGVEVKSYEGSSGQGIELHFKNKPAEAIFSELKESGFRLAYRSGKPYWFTSRTKNSKETALTIAAKQVRYVKVSEQYQELAKMPELSLIQIKKMVEVGDGTAEYKDELKKLREVYNSALPASPELMLKNPLKRKPKAKNKAASVQVKPKQKARKNPPKKATEEQPAVHPTKKLRREIGAGDLQKAEFQSEKLPGEIGKFLGEVDRHGLAILITGEKSTGKSHLAFQISKCFVQHGLTGKFFSLEEGIGKTSQDKVIKYKIGNTLRIIDDASIESVRSAARVFDFVVIDSWLKLGAKATEFDKLRKSYPSTIFVVIFQQTTGGKIRGGSSFEYDAPMVIEVLKSGNDRIASMEKSRYNTIGWTYSIIKEKVQSTNQ